MQWNVRILFLVKYFHSFFNLETFSVNPYLLKQSKPTQWNAVQTTVTNAFLSPLKPQWISAAVLSLLCNIISFLYCAQQITKCVLPSNISLRKKIECFSFCTSIEFLLLKFMYLHQSALETSERKMFFVS